MTETEWLTSEDPQAMHEVVRETAFRISGGYHRLTQRKRNFFSAACCRLVWPLISVDVRCRRLVEYWETQYEAPISEKEIDDIWGDVKAAARHPEEGTPVLQGVAANLVYDAEATADVIAYLLRSFDEWGDPKERAVQIAHIMRDIVGNPYCPVIVDPQWLTSTVIALARQLYDSRDFSAMPILADALQDAGCDADELLTHLRHPGPHTRGCWVLDLVLGKS